MWCSFPRTSEEQRPFQASTVPVFFLYRIRLFTQKVLIVVVVVYSHFIFLDCLNWMLELYSWVFSCSALRQARFINSATCLCCFPLSLLHWDKKCWVFNASIHTLTNKHYVWVALTAYSMCVCSVLCVFSFRGRKAASLCFVYLATSQGCLTNAFWIVSLRTFVLCFIHRCDVL